MDIELLTERYAAQIAGVLSCWDRLLVFGSLPKICYAGGMTSYLYERKVRIFDYPGFAEPFRNQLRENAERLATEAGIEIEFVRKRNVRKEDRVKEALARRGEHPVLVCILSAMEPCSTYKPWHDKPSGRTFLKPDDGKCLHYYFYFIDEELGLCYVRVPTWRPCRRDVFALRFCPIHRSFGADYHWSVDQCEYSTDIVFRKQADLQPLHENLRRTALHTVKPDNIATFLGKKLSPQFEDKMGNRFNTRIEGTRIKHTMGSVLLKLYDKFAVMLRIETTVNGLTFFKHYREVEHRDGSRETKWAAMQKTIYSLPALCELLAAANRRYLEFLSTIADRRNGRNKLDKLSPPVAHEGRSYPGFNFFDEDDDALFRAIACGKFNIGGMQNKSLHRCLAAKTSAQVSRLLKRLRLHGMIKKIGRTYKY